MQYSYATTGIDVGIQGQTVATIGGVSAAVSGGTYLAYTGVRHFDDLGNPLPRWNPFGSGEPDFSAPEVDVSRGFSQYMARVQYEDSIIRSMGNVTPAGFASPLSNSGNAYFSDPHPLRNDCSFRIGSCLGITEYGDDGFASSTAGQFLGDPVSHDPYRLQIVNWPGYHMGFRRGNNIFDYGPRGLHNGYYLQPRNFIDVNAAVERAAGRPISPAYYSIPWLRRFLY